MTSLILPATTGLRFSTDRIKYFSLVEPCVLPPTFKFTIHRRDLYVRHPLQQTMKDTNRRAAPLLSNSEDLSSATLDVVRRPSVRPTPNGGKPCSVCFRGHILLALGRPAPSVPFRANTAGHIVHAPRPEDLWSIKAEVFSHAFVSGTRAMT